MQAPNISISQHGISGVQFAEVTVDMETGVVKIGRIVAVQKAPRRPSATPRPRGQFRKIATCPPEVKRRRRKDS
jgi:hypothetical protein